MTPGEYATLGGSVLPLPPDGGTSHSQQVKYSNISYNFIPTNIHKFYKYLSHCYYCFD